ncbi:hypothetical protein AB1286_07865 [Trinickia sp. NRRL B-1857]|uniref:hypothetical protein n=1 Tax=Trinickia sp. NRRL B-1857 TaxID=3162879 RepID=UPI003D2AAAFE
MSILPDGAKVNEVEFNKTRAATHLNTLHLKEHAKFLATLQLELAAMQEQINELRRELDESKAREYPNALEVERPTLRVAQLSAALCDSPKASSRMRNPASEPVWRVTMSMPVEYIQGIEARAQSLGISASTYMQRVIAGMHPPLPELAKCIGVARPWRQTEEDRRRRKAQHKCKKEAHLEGAVPPL